MKKKQLIFERVQLGINFFLNEMVFLSTFWKYIEFVYMSIDCDSLNISKFYNI